MTRKAGGSGRRHPPPWKQTQSCLDPTVPVSSGCRRDTARGAGPGLVSRAAACAVSATTDGASHCAVNVWASVGTHRTRPAQTRTNRAGSFGRAVGPGQAEAHGRGGHRMIHRSWSGPPSGLLPPLGTAQNPAQACVPAGRGDSCPVLTLKHAGQRGPGPKEQTPPTAPHPQQGQHRWPDGGERPSTHTR